MRDEAILFTAFEPSGDALAAALIGALRDGGCRRPIAALGGPRMREAGAELIEQTTERAVMLADAAGQAWAHRQRMKRLARWMAGRRLVAAVPTDSPAANWSVCQLVRRRQPRTPIVHLAAPQLWAWAPWRIRKMRRLSDHVLCLLPFEPAWFAARGVAATFVGHPIFEAGAVAAPGASVKDGSDVFTDVGGVKLAILPGSRASEIRQNLPMMLSAWSRLRGEVGDGAAVVSLRDEASLEQLACCRSMLKDLGVGVAVGETERAIAWSDVVLVVSGTATLQVAARRRPMVIVYRVNRWSWQLAGRWLVRTRTFGLPNLIAQWQGGEPVVPELVPHFGDPKAIEAALGPLLLDGSARREQAAALEGVVEPFRGVRFTQAASRKLAELIDGG